MYINCKKEEEASMLILDPIIHRDIETVEKGEVCTS
jgi:hypothetical protein